MDDGSRDDTQSIAHGAGAVVARHTRNRGKAAALETGAAVVGVAEPPLSSPPEQAVRDRRRVAAAR